MDNKSVIILKQQQQQKWCLSDPSVGKISWRRQWQPSPAFLPGKSYGQRSLMSMWSWRVGHSWVTNTHVLKKESGGIRSRMTSFQMMKAHQKHVFTQCIKTITFFLTWHCYIYFFQFIYFWLLWLCCCLRAFSRCREWGPLSSYGARASHSGDFCCCGAQIPGTGASVVAACRLRSCNLLALGYSGFSSCGIGAH